MPGSFNDTPHAVDYRGLIAEFPRELGIIHILDERPPLPNDNRTKTNIGQRVMVMMLYGLAFSSAPFVLLSTISIRCQ